MSTIKVNAIKHIGGATDAINIASDSDVGIGTNSPAERLHIHKSAATGPFVYITNNSTGVSASDGIQIGYDGNNSTEFKNNEPTDIIFSTGGTERCRINHSEGGLDIARQNSTLEGGQIRLNRSSDNTAYWHLDSYGSSNTPDFRIHAAGTSHLSINPSGQWVKAPPGTIMQAKFERYDPNSDSYTLISQQVKARSSVYIDFTPLRSDSKLLIRSKCHVRMSGAEGCTFGVDVSTNSGGAWSTLTGMVNRNGRDFFYKGEALNHHYTGDCTFYEDASNTNSRRYSPWGQGWGAGNWELSYGHGEHSILVLEVAT